MQPNQFKKKPYKISGSYAVVIPQHFFKSGRVDPQQEITFTVEQTIAEKPKETTQNEPATVQANNN